MSRRDWPLLQRSRKAAELQVDGARVEVIGELAVAVILAIIRTGFSALVIKKRKRTASSGRFPKLPTWA
jgi:hypothetical protein